MSAAPKMKMTRLAPWYGGCATLAEQYAHQLGDLRWCGVPFCGGCPELPRIRCTRGVATDLHRHIINLARVIRSPEHWGELVEYLDARLFHPDELLTAQRRLMRREIETESSLFRMALDETPDVQWAADFFVACWMSRSGTSGKSTAFTQTLAVRYSTSGGDSAQRFRSAVESIEAWHLALRPWSFECVDAFKLLSSVVDEPGHGLYIDPPWPDAGDEYKHRFTTADQKRLRESLDRFAHARIVIRYGDHPLIRDLYGPAQGWTWLRLSGRNQANTDSREVLIVNGPLYEPSSKGPRP